MSDHNPQKVASPGEGFRFLTDEEFHWLHRMTSQNGGLPESEWRANREKLEKAGHRNAVERFTRPNKWRGRKWGHAVMSTYRVPLQYRIPGFPYPEEKPEPLARLRALTANLKERIQ